MKTEQIAKKAREYAYELLDRFGFTLEHTIACEYAYKKGYEDGKEEANAEWQEKVQNVTNYLEFEVHSDIADRVIQILNGEK